jgi:hypothetical protein
MKSSQPPGQGMTRMTLKQFIIDYYANIPYKELRKRYGLTPTQADKLWNKLVDEATYKNEQGGTTNG